MLAPSDIIHHFFKTNPYYITRHHIDSFNEFVMNKIPMVVKSFNPFIIFKQTPNNGQTVKIEIFVGGENGEDISFDKPSIQAGQPLYPNEARLKDRSYVCELYADILVRYTLNNDESTQIDKLFKKITIGTIPIMLHSSLCFLQNMPSNALIEVGEAGIGDQGGYFIIDGKEKVIIGQERNATNTVFITKSHDAHFTYEGFIHCISPASVFPKTTKLFVFSPEYMAGLRRNAIVVTVPHINTKIPLFILFRALGIESDKDILEYIFYDINDQTNHANLTFMEACAVDSNFAYTQEASLEYLKMFTDYKTVDHVRYILLMNLFPNIESDSISKAFFLGHIVNKLVRACIGGGRETDRDNYMYKRVDLSGVLIGDIFKDFYNAFRNNARSSIDKEYETGPWKFNINDISSLININNIRNFFQARFISDGMIKSLKGNWGLSNDADKKGIVQDLARVSYHGFISHLRRVNTPLDRSTKIIAPHRLNTSHYGVMCPVESPDGASIGLLKHMAMMCIITPEIPISMLMDALNDPFLVKLEVSISFVRDIHPRDVIHKTKILINNNWIAVSTHPERLVRYLRLMRRNNYIHPLISVSWDILENELHLYTEGGRCSRPLLLVKHNKNNQNIAIDKKRMYSTWADYTGFSTPVSTYTNLSKILKKDVLSEPWAAILAYLDQTSCVIEYIDVSEANTCLIAMEESQLNAASNNPTRKLKYTHCEIHPAAMFSMYTATIPLANHNQAPRNIFSGAQGKQAIGVYASNFQNRIDTMSYVLHYPQRAIVGTRFKEYFNNNSLPNGENLIVAIATYTGYNQEDAVIINKSAIQRGLFNLTYFKSHIEDEIVDLKTGDRVLFGNPLKENGLEIKKFANFHKLDDNGLPIPGVFYDEEDVIVGKVAYKTEQTVSEEDEGKFFAEKKTRIVKTDQSSVVDKTMTGFVDQVVVYEKNETSRCKIRMRKVRMPELGDKLASTHGQKGVIGMILEQQDMPFSQNGIQPDLIMNPHAIPSRMTIGHLIESVLAKSCVLQGTYGDGTPFEAHDYEPMWSELEKRGFERYGNEILYNGRTGEQIQTEIFFTPTFYFRLKHMVADKINFRATGPVTGTTKQPTKGRGNEGGLRIGEMEKDVLLSYGMSGFLKESFMERSDKHVVNVDEPSGSITYVNKKRMLQGSQNDIFRVQMPYAFKLLCQEMQGMLSVNMSLSRDPAQIEDFHEENEYTTDSDEEDANANADADANQEIAVLDS